MRPSASVIIPTHNRPAAVAETVSHCLASAERSGAEVVVVDDGSSPPVVLPTHTLLRIVRTPGGERSRARNQGARASLGELLIFVDDDISVMSGFVEQHLRVSEEFGDVLGVGRVSLPPEWASTPFGRFRRTIEEPSQNRERGFVARDNFCTAANMSIQRRTFLVLGGFDPAILSGEDQDLALRFSAAGGKIAYLPEADVIHRDSVGDIAAYGRRHEWGARALAPFLRRYPDRPENSLRLATATPLSQARWPFESGRILVRQALSGMWAMAFIRGLISAAQRAGAGDPLLFPLYRTLLGLHLFRGFRAGLAAVVTPPPLPQPLRVAEQLPGQTD
jgi:cellulose synthase/poly-beta-1,6-N-acetylglucosamine synthase-like glycosyltransferase